MFTYETDDDDKPVLSVKSQNDYYPFGLRHINPLLAAGSDTENRFLYNGKENQTAGLRGLLDYGARIYDPIIARWFNIDPLAEKYCPISPFAYVGNNPVRRIDLDGRDWVDAKGNKMWANGSYTQYATADFKRIGNNMRATKTGTASFDQVANSSAAIQVKISPNLELRPLDGGGRKLLRGEFLSSYTDFENGDVRLDEGIVIIYEGSLKAEIDGTVRVGGEVHKLINSLPEETRLEGAIGAVGVHESVHATNENTKQRSENKKADDKNRPKPHNTETKPEETEKRHLMELLGL